MARILLPLLKHYLVLLMLMLLSSSGGTMKLAHGTKTWCVAKPSSDDAILYDNIHWACSQPQVDCSVLRPNCPCFYPNTLISHASVAMNLYYQALGRNPWNCDFKGSALLVLTDPSFGKCNYPYL